MKPISKMALLAILAQSLVFALTGTVHDSQGNALSYVLVTFVDAGNSTTTNASGEFVLQAPVKVLPQGSQAFHFQVHQGVLNYSLSQSAEVQFQVHSLLGQVLQSSPKQVQSQGAHVYAPAQKLSLGLYLLRYHIGKEQGVLPLQVTENFSMNLRHDLMPLRKTAEGAEDSLQLEKSGYNTQRIAVVDYTADMGVIVMQKHVANPQNCLYSEVNNTLACAEKTYKTVVIGTQVWMAENLNYGNMVTSATGQVNDASVEKFCYSDTLTYCNNEGGFYTWAEALALPSSCNSTICATQISSENHQGICPTGWHIPSNEEWTTVANYIAAGGGGTIVGKKMKLNHTGFSTWDALTYNDGNSSGFSAFPAGYIGSTGAFYNRGKTVYYREASENSASSAKNRSLKEDSGWLNGAFDGKKFGFSVRCLKD